MPTTWGQIASAYQLGIDGLTQQVASNLAAWGLGGDLPLVEESLSGFLEIPSVLKEPLLDPLPDDGACNKSLEDIEQIVQSELGTEFSVLDWDNCNLDPVTNDVIRLKYFKEIYITDPFTTDTDTGFDYFDKHSRGELDGSLSVVGNPKFDVSLTFGVDDPDREGPAPLQFFLAKHVEGDIANQGKLSVPYFKVEGAIKGTNCPVENPECGNMGIGALLNVHIVATGKLENNGSSLQLTTTNADGKLRISDLGSSSAVSGSITGFAGITGALSAQLSVLPTLTWSGTWNATINCSPSCSIGTSQSFVTPDATTYLKQIAGDFFGKFNDLDLLPSSLQSFYQKLNEPIPFVDKSIAELLGINGAAWLAAGKWRPRKLGRYCVGIKSLAESIRRGCPGRQLCHRFGRQAARCCAGQACRSTNVHRFGRR